MVAHRAPAIALGHARADHDRLPAGVYLPAFSSRLTSTRSISTASNFDQRQIGRQRDVARVRPAERRPRRLQRAADHLLERLPLRGCSRTDAALEPRHVQQVVDQRVHAGAPARRSPARSRCWPMPAAGRACACSDSASPTSAASGVRRSCEMRRQQRVAQALGLHLHRRLLRHVDVVHALQRDREQRGEGVELLRAAPGIEQPARLCRLAAPARRACASAPSAAGRARRCRAACRCRGRPAGRGRRPSARRRCRSRRVGRRDRHAAAGRPASGTSTSARPSNSRPIERPRRSRRTCSVASAPDRSRASSNSARDARFAVRRDAAPGSAARR